MLLAVAPVASGCFGSFHITRKVYNFNKSATPNKWVRWCLFMGMNIIPVYTSAVFADVVLRQSGRVLDRQQPDRREARAARAVGADGSVAQLIPVDGGARIVVTETTGAVHELTLLREAPGVVAVFDRDGTLVRRVSGLGSDEPQVVELAAAAR